MYNGFQGMQAAMGFGFDLNRNTTYNNQYERSIRDRFDAAAFPSASRSIYGAQNVVQSYRPPSRATVIPAAGREALLPQAPPASRSVLSALTPCGPVELAVPNSAYTSAGRFTAASRASVSEDRSDSSSRRSMSDCLTTCRNVVCCIPSSRRDD